MYITRDSDKKNEILKGTPHFDHSDNYWRYEKLKKLNNICREIRFPLIQNYMTVQTFCIDHEIIT